MRQVPLESDINIAGLRNIYLKWMFWVPNLLPERAIYGNVDITL